MCVCVCVCVCCLSPSPSYGEALDKRGSIAFCKFQFGGQSVCVYMKERVRGGGESEREREKEKST